MITRYYTVFIYFIICASTNLIAQSYQKDGNLKPKFTDSKWIVNLAECNVYDDDLLFGKLTFNDENQLIDTISNKINSYVAQYDFEIYSREFSISEAGKGSIDFYSTKRNQKYVRPFYFFTTKFKKDNYIVFIIDIEKSGQEYFFPFRIDKRGRTKRIKEIQILDIRKQWADYRLIKL